MAERAGRRFSLVDVFGDTPMSGNPLAVVVDSDGLATEEMQDMTRWFGFSETTFLMPGESPNADYRVRIFTLTGELPFAGHPTLGTCHVWRRITGHAGDEAVQECGAGLVRLRIEGQRIAFEAPPLIRDGPVDESTLEEVAAVLGVGRSDIRASKWVDNGPGWVGVLLDGSDAVLDLSPDFSRATRPGELNIGVVGLHREGWECLYEVRAFFAGSRGEMIEDPVTGSLNASVAQWLIGAGLAKAPYVAAQGTALGRKGRVHIGSVDGSIWVGGRVFDVVDGHLTS